MVMATQSLKQRTDEQLIEYFRAGRLDAFEELISRYSSKAYSLASRLTRNQEDAEEVLQDVFVTVFRKIAGFQGNSTFSSWFYRVTVNASFMKLRKRKQDHSVPFEDLLPQIQNSLRTNEVMEGDSAAFRNEVLSALEQAIGSLPDDYRPVFVLRDVDGMSSREVAKVLDITVPAVKSRLHRSRMLVRRRLNKFYKEIQGQALRSAGNG